MCGALHVQACAGNVRFLVVGAKGSSSCNLLEYFRTSSSRMYSSQSLFSLHVNEIGVWTFGDIFRRRVTSVSTAHLEGTPRQIHALAIVLFFSLSLSFSFHGSSFYLFPFCFLVVCPLSSVLCLLSAAVCPLSCVPLLCPLSISSNGLDTVLFLQGALNAKRVNGGSNDESLEVARSLFI